MKVRRIPITTFIPFNLEIKVESDVDVQALNYILKAADKARRVGCPSPASVTHLHQKVQGVCAMLNIALNTEPK